MSTKDYELDPHGRPIVPAQEELVKLPPDGGPRWNRLVFEKSPYLLQHAANPVDWRPWGEEAFEEARKQGKPVFLSVGYTSCHWCHVMEKESFEDEEVARLMNEAFVCVKVDREERPDVDHVYMMVTQSLTGHGGWPMTVVMTPDKRPFFAGTYYPKFGRYGRHGMMELVPGLARAWRDKRAEILESAKGITEMVSRIDGGTPGGDPGVETLEKGFQQLASRFDDEHGGFGGAPKFPTPHNLSFLFRHHIRTGSTRAREMAEKTLLAMRRGGVYDHVGFGLHRYSTDSTWLLPHFEKMLYDQATLTLAAIDGYQATRDERHAILAREIGTYVLRDMTAKEGGFHSAEDADSEGEEGKFYVWSQGEVDAVLGADDGAFFREVLQIVEGGNFHEEATGASTGRSIPHLAHELSVEAEKRGLTEEGLRARIESCRQRLYDEREKRVRPQKDDKILTDWNGLMIAALARAGQVLGEERFVLAARRAMEFVLSTLRTEEGRLLKRYRQGEAGLPGHLDDYTSTIFGLIELHQATQDVHWLTSAMAITETLLGRFHDDAQGGFFLTADDGEDLLVRSKVAFDNATPSGNSVAAVSLARLARLTGRVDFEEKAAGVLRAFSRQIEEAPSAHTHMLQALDLLIGPSVEIVIVGKRGATDTCALLAAARSVWFPASVLLLKDVEDASGGLDALAPFTKDMGLVSGKAAAFLCRSGACERPVTEPAELVAGLEGSRSR
jgi:hypothetical protein